MLFINTIFIFHAAYYLNPKYQYDHNIALDEELLMALRNAAYRLKSDLDLAAEAISEVIKEYIPIIVGKPLYV